MNEEKEEFHTGYPTIYLGSDHAGFSLKNDIHEYLEENGYEVFDFGPIEFNESDDYPDVLHPLAAMLSSYPDNIAFVCGGSGMGEMMVLNRYPHVRCGVYYGGKDSLIELLREHNNANALSFGARFIDKHEAFHAIDLFLHTQFNHEIRHERRIQHIETLFKNNPSDNSTE